MATLFVVATPIGNLGDLSPRAAEALTNAHAVVAEDTRRTRALLTHLGITGKHTIRLDAHATPADVERVASELDDGRDLALVTDAGTPGVSDPGDALVRAAIARGVGVVPVPGASAVLAALTGSGLGGGGAFRFLGFLPREGTARREAIERVCATPEPVILFESPVRTRATLEELAAATPARPACVARELTKVHEEFTRGSLAELAAHDREWIGEIAIVLGAHAPEARAAAVTEAEIDARIDAELAAGERAKAIADRLAAWTGLPKRDLYDRVTRRKPSK